MQQYSYEKCDIGYSNSNFLFVKFFLQWLYYDLTPMERELKI